MNIYQIWTKHCEEQANCNICVLHNKDLCNKYCEEDAPKELVRKVLEEAGVIAKEDMET